ncbi:hypothetical protein Tco_0534932 [Tanacetum coccineum]
MDSLLRSLSGPRKVHQVLVGTKDRRERRFVKCMRSEVVPLGIVSAPSHAVVAEFEAMENQEEVHDSWLAAKDARRGEQDRLDGLNELIDDALEEIEKLETNVEILEGLLPVGEFDCVRG